MYPPTNDQKIAMSTIEDIEASRATEQHQARGTVKLLDDGTVILIPTPSPDPKGLVTAKENS